MSISKPTNAELAILRVLWKKGASTVREVYDDLSNTQSSGYTTVLKFMQIMYKKGLVTRDSSAKAHVYIAAVTEEEAEQGIVKDLLDGTFQGSAQKLVLSALSMKTSTPEELAEIRRLIDQLEKEQ
ncbi:MAG: BlaI/MecI/CopY family transcriptional regulator [Rhodothermales bacterium]